MGFAVTFENNEAKLIDNRRFIVTINREQAYRRHQLTYVDTFEHINGLLSSDDFIKNYGFDHN